MSLRLFLCGIGSCSNFVETLSTFAILEQSLDYQHKSNIQRSVKSEQCNCAIHTKVLITFKRSLIKLMSQNGLAIHSFSFCLPEVEQVRSNSENKEKPSLDR